MNTTSSRSRTVAVIVLPAVAALVVLAVAWPTAHVQVGLPPAVSLPVGLAAAAPVALAGRYPAPGWLLSALAATVVGLLVELGPDRTWPVPVVHAVALLVLLAVVVVRSAPWVVALAAVGTVAVAAVALRSPEAVLLSIASVAGVLVVGLLGRQLLASRRALHASEEDTEAERARRSVLQERARIARDLHDVVAHSMSMIVVRAETARYRLPAVSDDAATEFAALADAARHALGEVRGVLGVLRTEEEADHRPQPTVADVDALLDDTARAGVLVHATVTGDREVVGAATAVSLHRIVAEALANASRHAAGAPVTVALDYGPEEVHLRVEHGPGRSSTGPGSGLGLPGMRERATAVGGELAAGPTPDGGFSVTAALPTARTADRVA